MPDLTSVYKTVTAASAGLTTVWTPPPGRRFHLLGFSLTFMANAEVNVPDGTVVNATLFDGAVALPLMFSAYVPIDIEPKNITPAGSGWVTLGYGVYGSALGNPLRVNLSHTLTQGSLRVQTSGTEAV